MKNSKRILQVLGGMNRGGVETWLMNVLRNIDRDKFEIDFLVHTDLRCAYDDEIESLGARIFRGESPHEPIAYIRRLRHILKECGPYDVVHSHVHHFSGVVMAAAKMAGVPNRIAHSHTDARRFDLTCNFFRQSYLRLMDWLVRRDATLRLAASDPSACSLFGDEWRSDPRTRVVHCGIDFAPFRSHVNREEVRAEFGFRPGELVIGHVGNFVMQKNHAVLVDILSAVLNLGVHAQLLLVGGGALESDIRRKSTALGIADRVHITGTRSDVARILLGAMDVFVMPSLCEGLGLAAIEAQAAGLPCILSDLMPVEVDAGAGLVRFMGLHEPAREWAAVVSEATNRVRRGERQALAILERSSFAVERAIESLIQAYCWRKDDEFDHEQFHHPRTPIRQNS